MTSEGIGPCLAVGGATTRVVFEAYDLEKVLVPSLRRGQMVAMDNLVSAHKGERVRELVRSAGCELLYLPPYSPDFSPIEEAFSKVKGLLRKAGATSLLTLILIFVGAAAFVWVAGIKLSGTADVPSEHLGLGEALGGLIILAIVTNLPEIAIVSSAALRGNLGVATGNVLGGIAIQTVVLVVLDVFGVKGRCPLTYRAASLALVLESVLLTAILAVAIMNG
jgi:hypothetical protein